MASAQFGNPKSIAGQGGAFTSTMVPMELLRNLKRPRAIPITISGANQVTFTVNAGVTNKVPIWNGDDFMYLDETVAYTWAATANAILDSTGAVASNTGSTLGMWYFYIGYVSGVPTLYPSQTAPAEVEAPYPAGFLAHPGTARVRPYSYVGFHLCSTAATPVFVAMTKTGFVYNTGDITVATTATWAELAFTAAKALPAHEGVTVAGYLETGANGSVTVSGNATDGVGGQTVSDSAGTSYAPFSGTPTTSNGKLWAKDVTARGDVHVKEITDIA